MSNGTNVRKRNGSIEPLDLQKMHVMVEESCKDLAGVSASQVEINSGVQFFDGITTAEIQEILIKSASDLIDLDAPNNGFLHHQNAFKIHIKCKCRQRSSILRSLGFRICADFMIARVGSRSSSGATSGYVSELTEYC